MPYLLVASKRLPLRTGRNVLGGADADAPTGSRAPLAVIEIQEDGSASIYATRMDADLRVDGGAVDVAPVPLAHGSKVEVGGRKLLYADERYASGTSHLPGVSVDTAAVSDDAMPAAPSDRGGTLVSDDGTRYAVPETGLDIGRDPNCDIVIASVEVSRWHAQIVPGLMGYQLRDSSTNGVFVNGARVHGERWLSIGDVVRVGSLQFRFEGEAASYEPNRAEFDTGEMPVVVPNETPAPPAPRETHDTVRIARSALPTGPQAPLLATLEIINEGVLKGKRFRITRPLLHVGRGSHNEIALPEPSVSSTHATLQRRGAQWFVVDADSTNGTYVDGERLTGERAIPAVCELRFGGIKAVFRAVAGGVADDPSTKVVAGLTDDALAPRRKSP